MVSLVDVVPQSRKVDGVEVTGITAKGIGYLLSRWPEVRMAMSGMQVAPEQWVQLGPDIVAAIIACGTGHVGEEDQEAAAARFTPEQQLNFLVAIQEISFPTGLQSFMERFEALAGRLAGVGGKAPATPSQKT